jgi:hypothetical protein
MGRLFYVFIVTICIGLLCSNQVTLGQDIVDTAQIQTGFAVVTPLSGTIEGLSVSETFGELVNGNLFQSSVLPSPLVTLTSVVVNVDPSTGTNTGVAIVSPTNAIATVTLTLLNQHGSTIAARTITIDARQQLSRFVSELFGPIPELSTRMTGQMFVASDVPVGVLALSFNGPSFTSLPVAAQLSLNNIVSAGKPTPSTFTTTGVTPPQTFANGNPVSPPFVPTTVTPLPVNVLVLPPTVPITGVPTPLVNATVPITTPTGSTSTFTGTPVTTTQTTSNGGLLLPQVAAGGGWVSQITIANTSNAAQTVSVDFFNSLGGPMSLPFGSAVPNVVIPSGGVVTISTLR